MFKNIFGREAYVKIIKDRDVRSLFTKLRISAHKLNIETGRYRNIPAEHRYCNLCKNNCVEDEIHFSMSCNMYNTHRNELFKQVSEININFSSLSDKQKFVWLMSTEDPAVILLFSKFLYNIYSERNVMLLS